MVFQETNASFHGDVYKIMWKMSIKPLLRSWVKEIMDNPYMEEGERRGKILAYQEIYKGFLNERE